MRTRTLAKLSIAPTLLLAAFLIHAEKPPGDSTRNPRPMAIGPATELGPARMAEAAELSRRFPRRREPRPARHGQRIPEPPATHPLQVPDASPPDGEIKVKASAITALAGPFSYQPRLARSFFGHDSDGSAPADPMIAAGPTHLVAVVNTQIAFFTKEGANVFESDLDLFFGLGPTNSFDPKVLFDEDSQRFFVLMISRKDTPPRQSFFHFALSQTADPTQGWWIYGPQRNDLDGEWIDYPQLGVGARGLYFTGNYVALGWPTPPGNHNVTLWVLDKAGLLTGGITGYWVLDDVAGVVPGPVGTLAPTLTYGTPPGGADAFVTTNQGGAGSDIIHLVYGVTLPASFPSAGPSLAVRSVSQTNPGGMPNAPQLGGPALIQANNLGSLPMNAVYQNGWLHTVYHWPGGAGTRLQPIECDVSAWPSLGGCNGPFYEDPGRWLYWPSFAVNHHGDALIGTCASSASEFVSARWGHRFEDEGLFGPTRLLRSGDGYYGNPGDTSASLYRWGDYSGAAVDPADHGFWIFNKYPAGGGTVWATWIGYVPRAVFVDGLYAGTERGSPSRPWNTVGEGATDALGGNDLVIRTGSYPEVVTLDKPVTIVTDGGPVTIGR